MQSTTSRTRRMCQWGTGKPSPRTQLKRDINTDCENSSDVGVMMVAQPITGCGPTHAKLYRYIVSL